jgi:signal transduction histidine kinase
MNQHLQTIVDLIQKNESLSSEQRSAILKSLADAGKELEITAFKLDRTEKVKKTTAILLEQTIAELEQKRKAVEEQNRELEIETALEKVRSSALAMKQPADMLEVCKIISQQLNLLKVKDIRNVQTAIFNEGKGTYVNYEYYTKHDKILITETDFKNHPVAEQFANQMTKGPNEFFTHGFEDKEVKDWLNYQRTTNVFIDTYLETASSLNYYWYSLGPVALGISAYASLSEEEINLFKRFRNVFELAYRRYLDIEKAEAQAREAQIQLALERVRARTMAMHKSEELAETAQVLFLQLEDLGGIPDRISIGIVDETKQVVNFWTTDQKGSHLDHNFSARLNERTVIAKTYKAWKEQQQSLVIDLQGEELKEWVQFAREEMGIVVKDDSFKNRRVHTLAFFSHGWILVSTLESQSLESIHILERFASVFNLTYCRFLDLQKAEAQAREAKIEAALERVRSRAMGMHTSEELNALIGTVFTELTRLDLILTRCVIMIYDQKTNDARWWMTNSEAPEQPMNFQVQYHEHPPNLAYIQGWKERKIKWQYVLEGKIKEDWDDFIFMHTELSQLPDFVIAGMKAPDKVYLNASFYSFGNLTLASLSPLSDEHFDILIRFAKVFDLTYTRFNDLKQAEASARESRIEAALEKVRGKAMAMHSSNDLSITTSMVFTELRKLGINPIRCGVGLLNKESHKAQLYSATSSDDGDSLSLVGWVMLSGHPVLEKIYNTWLKNEEYYPELSGEQLKSYYELLLSGLSVPVPSDTGQKQYGTFLPFSVGCLYAWSEDPYADTEIKILKRFATIIDLTFRRYIELRKSEANAKEAIKQSALDRIRADIASMRTTNDLERITPLIWNELTILGIPFIRCGVFIMDEEQQLIHTFLSTPDGKAIAAFHIPYNTPGNIAQVLNHWKNKKIYTDHWDEKSFTEFADTLVKQGALASPVQYLQTIPHGGFHLHFLPFLQGMLYVGNSTQLNEQEIKLIQSLADAFSTAYARYEDFNKLEAAKKQVDSTLNELQATQKQLIQSEKMASLGELTAGIAHEIQNPLNFVNNFAEVNTELVDELKQEALNGNAEEVRNIAQDLKDNNQKIAFHGKRAESIVKGMLQHSRTSTGKKEMTDINSLADEFFRLSYHGLRAKDKSFNATMETKFDESIGEIEIVPQDLGRVLLNLFNNAFYSVNEKKKFMNGSFDPKVFVCTERQQGKIEIIVKDNGTGIPQKVIDKIYQPFFTTKPTGEGTGLGLSLSYDIITKGHNGQLKVETKEGEFAQFTIILPA